MSYVVNWQSGDGALGWHPVSDLNDAAAHVEHLRNSEGVDGAKIYRLDEVFFELKPYYRVAIADAPATATPGDPSEAEAAVVTPAHADESWVDPEWTEEDAPADEPEADPESVFEGADNGANGAHRRGLFGR